MGSDLSLPYFFTFILKIPDFAGIYLFFFKNISSASRSAISLVGLFFAPESAMIFFVVRRIPRTLRSTRLRLYPLLSSSATTFVHRKFKPASDIR